MPGPRPITGEDALGVVFVLVKKTSDQAAQCLGVLHVSHGSGIVEEVLLQRGRQQIPLHDHRCAQTLQDVFFAGGQNAPIRVLRRMQDVVIVVRDPLLVVREFGQAAFALLPGPHNSSGSVVAAAFRRIRLFARDIRRT